MICWLENGAVIAAAPVLGVSVATLPCVVPVKLNVVGVLPSWARNDTVPYSDPSEWVVSVMK